MLNRKIRQLVSLSLMLASAAPAAVAQDAAYNVKQNYAKQEVMIPMRDGVKLFTIIYAPRAQSEKYPILLTRTAYGIAPYGADNYRAIVGPNNMFAKEGYIVAYQ
ncbi:MAG: CocE/NonD family hydrolase, partial [Gemmatimonadaceae bacterium]